MTAHNERNDDEGCGDDTEGNHDADNDEDNGMPDIFALCRTVLALHDTAVRLQLQRPDQENNTSATNTKTEHLLLEQDSYEAYFKKCGVRFQSKGTGAGASPNIVRPMAHDNDAKRSPTDSVVDDKYENSFNNNEVEYVITVTPVSSKNTRKAPNTLDLNTRTKKRKMTQPKRTNGNLETMSTQLNGILEECEYDSDVGKFNCKIDEVPPIVEQPVECSDDKMVMRRIEFFEKTVNNNDTTKRTTEEPSSMVNIACEQKGQPLSSWLCLGTFFLTCTLLWAFPLPE